MSITPSCNCPFSTTLRFRLLNLYIELRLWLQPSSTGTACKRNGRKMCLRLTETNLWKPAFFGHSRIRKMLRDRGAGLLGSQKFTARHCPRYDFERDVKICLWWVSGNNDMAGNLEAGELVFFFWLWDHITLTAWKR